MTEFWENAFQSNQEMWGMTPSRSAIVAKELFESHGAKNILIPGFGYGRNATVFRDSGIAVTGIEISQTAIKRAHEHFGKEMKIHHGSVAAMPFDDETYDGIFCYALIHLLGADERAKLISDCHNQLKPGGHMVFVTIAKSDFRFGQGTPIGTDRFEPFKGVQLFFHDAASVQQEFGEFGLIDCIEIEEPNTHATTHPAQRFLVVTCGKEVAS